MSEHHRWLEKAGVQRAASHKSGELRIAPFENFVAPSTLTGRDGMHRCRERCNVAVEDDWGAVDWWITRTSPTESTAAARRSAAEKLLNWACFQRGKALSSLDEQDFADFARFLSDPLPVERWIRSGRSERNSKEWRPFRRALSPTSLGSVMHHISSLIRWMERERYADLRCSSGKRTLHQGFSLSASEDVGRRYVDPEASLSVEEWGQIRHTLDKLYPSDLASSHRLIIELMYYGGYFLEDIAKFSLADMEPPNRIAPCWMIHRVAKRLHQHEVLFAPPPLSNTLSRWMARQQPVCEDYLHFSYNSASTSLLSMETNRIRLQANHVIHEAARLALGHGQVPLGLRLRDRTATAFRQAFENHLRPGTPSERAKRPLTGAISRAEFDQLAMAFERQNKGGLEREEKRPPPWDWSHAAELWTDVEASPSHARA